MKIRLPAWPGKEVTSLQVHPHMEYDEAKGLTIGGIPAARIARKFGTPLYVYSEDAIVDRMREYRTAMSASYPDGAVAYAGKAYLTMRMAQLVAGEGLYLDTASGGELYIALQAGFPAERIILHGNNKSLDELVMAVTAGVGRIVVDNLWEIDNLQKIAKKLHKVQGILMRLTPGIDPHTHKYLATGEILSKFGVPVHDGSHFRAVATATAAPNLNLLGFHCHIGSQIFETEPFLAAARIMMGFAADLRDKTGIVVSEIDLGGGLGVKYSQGPDEHGAHGGHPGETTQFTPAAHLAALGSEVQRLAAERGFPLPRLFVEPGRSIVAEAGLTLYTVGSVKELPNGVTVAAVDGGMADNPRPMLYNATYTAVPALPPRESAVYPVRIVGKHCEEGDTLIEQAMLPMPRPGDIMALLVGGAYQYAMRSNYNALPCPAVVHVADKRAFVVVQRQTYRDLIAKERLVPGSKIRIQQERTVNA